MEALQHVFVTIVAAGAAAVVVWRVARAGRSQEGPSCDTCPTARTIPNARPSRRD
jgi:hypothetical protein